MSGTNAFTLLSPLQVDLLPNREQVVYVSDSQACDGGRSRGEEEGDADVDREVEALTASVEDEEEQDKANDNADFFWEKHSHAEDEGESRRLMLRRDDGDWIWGTEDEGKWVDGDWDEEGNGGEEMQTEAEVRNTRGGMRFAQRERVAHMHGCFCDVDEGSDKGMGSLTPSFEPLERPQGGVTDPKAAAQDSASATSAYTRVNVSVATGYGLGRLVRVLDEVVKGQGRLMGV